MFKPSAALAAAGLLWAAAGPVASAEAAWLRAESPNFVVLTDTDEASARRYIRTLEQFDSLLRRWHGMDAKPARRKFPVYLLNRRSDLRRVAPALPSNVAGFYRADPEDTFAVATELRGDDAILLHEYVHHFMLQHYPYGYPAWLVEGYAEYFMTFDVKDGNVEVGKLNKNRGDWLAGGTWISFERLLRTMPRDHKGADSAMFYAQSWALTHWFLSDPARTRQLDRYIDAVGDGADAVKAMEEATGLKPNALASTVRKYLTRGFPYRQIRLADLPDPAVSVSRLGPAASAVVLTKLRISGDNGVDSPEDRTDGPVLLKAVRDAAKGHAGDRAADLVLARGEAKLGDRAEADRILTRLLQADPKDLEALELYADLKLRMAEDAPPETAAKLRGEARALAGRAFKIDPNRYQTLVAYIRGRQETASFPNENDLNVLLDALDLAPQVGAIRLNAAKALIRHKRYADAENVLGMLVNTPHPGAEAGEARGLLDAMRAAGQIQAAAD